jgi:uncharacterized protein
MTDFAKTPRNQVRRLPERAAYDRPTIYAILDEALICHVAFVQDGQPFIIPQLFARQGDRLLLHGSPNSRLLKHIKSSEPISVAVTLVDGLVLARSVFEHSVNYRSAVLFGRGRALEDPAEKMKALGILTEHILPGRWNDARQPNPKELAATMVVAVNIESASAKTRSGMPEELSEEDYALPVWAGILPIAQQYQPLQPDPRLSTETPVPEYLQKLLPR